MTGRQLPSREAIEKAVEALINLLDEIDGDVELEPEIDVAADDLGEPPGQTFTDPVLLFRKPTQ